MPNIADLEEKLNEASDSGLRVKRKRRSVRIIRNPTSICYEELFINTRQRIVSYFSLIYTQFLDTFLFKEKEFQKYEAIPFIKGIKERAENIVNGKKQLEYHSKKTKEGFVGVGGSDAVRCKDSDIVEIVDFFIKRCEWKKGKSDLYEKLNDLYARPG